MGKFDALAEALGLAVKKYGDDAAKILKKVDSPELATSLKGEARGDYLKALDEVYGPIEKRKAELGFGNKIYYHGTPYDLMEFDLSKVGLNTNVDKSGKATWLTSKPEVAEQYVSNFPNPEINPNILDLLIKGNYKTVDDLTSYTMKERGALNKLAAQEGKSGVIFKDIRDNVWEGPLAPGPSDVVSVLEPKNIRSTRAAFDPRFKDSPLLMAGALAAPMSQMEEKPSFNPLETLKEGAKVGLQGVRKASEAWEEFKRPYAEALGRQFNIAGATPEVEKPMQEIGNIALDPLNIIGGAPGAAIGLLQTASQFAPKSPKEEALSRIRAGKK